MAPGGCCPRTCSASPADPTLTRPSGCLALSLTGSPRPRRPGAQTGRGARPGPRICVRDPGVRRKILGLPSAPTWGPMMGAAPRRHLPGRGPGSRPPAPSAPRKEAGNEGNRQRPVCGARKRETPLRRTSSRSGFALFSGRSLHPRRGGGLPARPAAGSAGKHLLVHLPEARTPADRPRSTHAGAPRGTRSAGRGRSLGGPTLPGPHERQVSGHDPGQSPRRRGGAGRGVRSLASASNKLYRKVNR